MIAARTLGLRARPEGEGFLEQSKIGNPKSEMRKVGMQRSKGSGLAGKPP